MNFRATLMTKLILANFLSQKKLLTYVEHSYLKYALVGTEFRIKTLFCNSLVYVYL